MAVRIVYSGDEAAAHTHLPAAQNLLHKTRVQASTSGAGVTGLSLFLAAGAYAYTLKIDDMEVIFIHAETDVSNPPPRKPRLPPDFLSGATLDARIEQETAVINGEDVVREVLKEYKPAASTAEFYDLAQTWQSSERLAVSASSEVVDGATPDTSQFQHIVPSMYSGRMRKLVQVLLGYGKVAPSGAPETDQGTDESNDEAEVKVRYDYRWHRTHILHTADDGVLWLVEISMTNGVIAMPLPIYEESQGLKDSDRTDIAAAAEEFDGLPTGEAFPTGKNLADALTAGNIVQLLSREALQEFHRLHCFSTMHGWTTNTRGSEAYNVAWYFGSDGMRRSRVYRLEMHIGAIKENRQQDEPIANATGRIYRKETARFYHPSGRNPPPYKVYEPLSGGIISVGFTRGSESSVDISPGEPDEADGGSAVSEFDAPMFVAYLGDQLHTVRYHWFSEPKAREVETNDGPCRFNGTVQTIDTTYFPAIPTFYSEAINSRSWYPRSRTRTLKQGSFLFLQNFFSLIPNRLYPPQWYSQWRNHIFRVRHDYQNQIGAYTRTAVVTAEGLRDGYALAEIENKPTTITHQSMEYVQVMDPYAYNTFSWFFRGDEIKGACWSQYIRRAREKVPVDDVMTSHSYTDSNGNSVTYSLNACRPLVDRGEWLKECEVAPNTIGPSTPIAGSSPVKIDPEKMLVKARLYISCGGATTLTLPDQNDEDDPWVVRSPDPDFGHVQTMSTRFSTMGASHQAYHNRPDGHLEISGALLDKSDDSGYRYNFLGVL